MGLNIDFNKEIKDLLGLENMVVTSIYHEQFQLLWVEDTRIIINLLTLRTPYLPEILIKLQSDYHQEEKVLIHLWEDVWLTRKVQVLSRLKSLLGRNHRIHGRSTVTRKLTKLEAESFFNLYHLQGAAGGRYHYGLFYQNELVVAASFSNKRNMKEKAEGHTSAELIRFATKDGYTVIGGLSKIIKHYVQMARPDDLMSYADRDWSHGKGYLSAGFQLKAVTPPVLFYLHPITLQRYSENKLPESARGNDVGEYIEIFNTGNLKYVLDL